MFTGGRLSDKPLRVVAACIIALTLSLFVVSPTTAFAAEGSETSSQNPIESFFSSVASFFGANDSNQLAAGDESTQVDESTIDSWQTFLTDQQGNVSTENIGRIWTDKSVFDGNVTLKNTEPETGGQQQITVNLNQGDGSDSSFLVGLSALATASNTTTYTSQPLDIVLVLDMSSSMDQSMGGSRYTEVYEPDLDKSQTYYIEEGGWFGSNYQEVTWNDTQQQWGYYSGGGWGGQRWNTVTPKSSASDRGGEQFYQYNGGTKLQALQNAVDRFIDSTAEQNKSAAADAQHRISIVKFADEYRSQVGNDMEFKYISGQRQQVNYSQVVSTLQPCTEQNADQLKQTVANLKSGGVSTQADAGLRAANQAMDDARDGARKVVVFFTDGEPNTYSSGQWQNEVLTGSAEQSKALKDKGVLVYSVGVVNGANPDARIDTTEKENINAFLHSVSSNYPDSTGWHTTSSSPWGGESGYWDMGNRAPDSNYYMAATDSTELNQIFQDISQQISEGLASATETTDAPEYSGYVTFTDKLGDYMQLDDARGITVVYNHQEYTCTSHRTDGAKDTYYFTSTPVGGNGVYGEGNLENLVMTVTHGSTLAEGDTVTVQIPASLLPHRRIDVNTDEAGASTMSVANAWPIRVFFGVQPKDGVVESLTAGTAQGTMTDDDFAALQTYADQHRDDEGNVSFLSNSWSGEDYGDAKAEFNPADSNNFYYFAQNTTIYTDADCQNPAKRQDIQNAADKTFYYKHTYYTGKSGQVATEQWTAVKFPGNSLAIVQGSVNYDSQGNAYVPAHTPRLTRAQDFHQDKTNNVTETAKELLSPVWNDTSSAQAATTIIARQGNNGKLSVGQAGELAISKTVTADAGLTAPDASFPFTLELTGAPTSSDPEHPTTFTGKVFKDEQQPDGSTKSVQQGDDITFDATGGDFTLKAGETLHVYGLSDGMGYTVTEKAHDGAEMPAGFTQTAPTTGDPAQPTNATGAIAAGKAATAAFTNNYSATPATLNGSENLKGTKTLTGRDWLGSDTFSFRLIATEDAPLPSGAQTDDQGRHYVEVTLNDKGDTKAEEAVPFNFDNIEFTSPGNYVYTISEQVPAAADLIPGMTYSKAVYRVTVTVSDDGQGALEVSKVAMDQRVDDGGVTHTDPVAVESGTAAFTNTYSAEQIQWGPRGTKIYTDNSGAKPLSNGMFYFQIDRANGEVDTPLPDNNVVTCGVNGVIQFPQLPITASMVGNTYHYTVQEVVKQGDAYVTLDQLQGATYNKEANTYTLNGMTYDATVHNLTVTVTDSKTAEGASVAIEVTCDEQQGDLANLLTFKNSYTPTPVTITTSANDAIHGTKTMTGRDMLEGESFGFKLTADDTQPVQTVASDSTVPAAAPLTTAGAIDAGYVTLPQGTNWGEGGTLHQSVSGGAKDEAKAFSFGDMTFNRPGTYTFNISEDAADPARDGVTYDKNICTVTVTVTDVDGELSAAVAYKNSAHADVADQAAFTNAYAQAAIWGAAAGLNVSKTLTGRPMATGEFDFIIKGMDSGTVNAGEADNHILPSDASFENDGAAASGVANTMEKLKSLSFTQDDIGKTYSYVVSEAVPAEGEGLAGVTYDKSTYQLDLTVSLNDQGQLQVVATLTQTADKDDSPVSEGTSATQTVTVTSEGTTVTAGETLGVAFANDYTPTPAVLTGDSALAVTKAVTGAPWDDANGNFTFTLTNTSEDGAKDNVKVAGTGEGELAAFPAEGMNKSTTGDIAIEEPQKLTFDDVLFTEPGTYTFQVAENEPTARNGWTWDTNPRTITVSVSLQNDQGEYDGALHATFVGNSNNPTVTNTYKANSVTLSGNNAVKVQKTVTGRDTEADFTFSLVPGPDAAAGIKDGSITYEGQGTDKAWDGTVTISDDFMAGQTKTADFGAGNITFTKTGDYEFTVIENNAQTGQEVPAGWTYDSHASKVTVHVTDNNYDGQLDVTIDYDNNVEGAIDADKSVVNAAAFTNRYETKPATLTSTTSSGLFATKTLDGRSSLENEWFNFTLSGADKTTQDALESPTEGAITYSEGALSAIAGGTNAGFMQDGVALGFHFGELTFHEAGTYTFNVAETGYKDGALPEDGTNGMTFDRHTGTYTVVITDDGEGQLHVDSVTPGEDKSGEPEGENNSTAFTNRYQPKPVSTTAGQLAGTKTYTDSTSGSHPMKDGDFTFYVVGQGKNLPMPTGEDASEQTTVGENEYPAVTVTNSGTTPESGETQTASYDFGTIEFTAAGTYSYNVREQQSSETLTGVSFDPTIYRVEYQVSEDKAAGTLSVGEPKIYVLDSDPQQSVIAGKLNFKNSYNAGTVTGSTQIGKTLNGRDFKDGDEFVFEVSMTAKDGAEASVWSHGRDKLPQLSNEFKSSATLSDIAYTDGGLSYTATIKPMSGSNMTFNAGMFDYTTPGIYTYTVKEQAKNGNGLTSDTTVYTLEVTITDAGQNELTRTSKITKGEGEAISGDILYFTNTYNAGDVTLDDSSLIKVQKSIANRDWKNGENYYFALDAYTKNAPMPAEGGNHVTLSGTGSDAATGTFGAITYKKSDLVDDQGQPVMQKDFTYRIYETNADFSAGVQPSDDTGMTFDQHNAYVSVRVTDNGDGTMSAKILGYDNSDSKIESDKGITGIAAFTNVYSTKPVVLTGDTAFTVTKQVAGAPWKGTDGSFGFTMMRTDEGAADAVQVAGGDTGTLANFPVEGIQVATSGDIEKDASKTLTFADVTFTQAGTYTFDVKENTLDPRAGWTWDDDAAKTITVTVSDNQNGQLEATTKVTPQGGEEADTNNPVFTNKYQAAPATLTDEAKNALEVTKTVTGHDTDEHFGFTAVLASNNADGVKVGTGTDITDWTQDTKLTATATEAFKMSDATENGSASQTVSFGDVSFTKAGTYKFTVTEDNAQEGQTVPEGWTYDNSAKTITVTVGDENYDGQLDITSVSTTPVFTNSYNAGEVIFGDDETALTVNKTFTGRDNDAWNNADRFDFTLTPQGGKATNAQGEYTVEAAGVPMPAGANADTHVKTITINRDSQGEGATHTGSFGTISYGMADRGMTYYYEIAEVSGNVYGTTYSQAKYQLAVSVSDNNDGSLKVESALTKLSDDAGATVDADKAAVQAVDFANAYKKPVDEKTVTTVDSAEAEPVEWHGQLVGVGDTVTYKIHWVNDQIDANGVAQNATVSVTDELPSGLTYQGASVEPTSVDGQKLTWNRGEQNAAAEGDIIVTATVNDAAASIDGVTNTATVKVGENNPKTVTNADVVVPEKTVENKNEGERPDGTAFVGDELTYTIHYKNTTNSTATIVVTDELPVGLEITNFKDGQLGQNDKGMTTLTWTIDNVPAGGTGTVSFSAQVTADALSAGTVNNQALVKVGNNPEVKTNTTETKINTGALTITKTVKVTEGQGTEVNTDQGFTFKIDLKDVAGNELAGSYAINNAEGTAGKDAVKSGDTITLKHGQTAVISGLPEGATYTVTETDIPAGYTPDAAQKSGTITTEGVEAAFTNTYNTMPAHVSGDAKNAIQVTKQVTGHDSVADYKFDLALKDAGQAEFVREGVTEDNKDGAAFDGDTLTIAGANGAIKNGGTDTASFANLTFTKGGDYEFTITEQGKDTSLVGWTYDTESKTVTVHVTDGGEGNLVAEVEDNNPTVTNSYKPVATMFRAAKFQLQGNKVIDGRTWEEGDTFTFNLEPGVGTYEDGTEMPADVVKATMPEKQSDTIEPLSDDGSKKTDNSAQFSFTDTRYAGDEIVPGVEDAFTFEQPGTYRYGISEYNPNAHEPGSGILGVSYDQTQYRLTVVVADESGTGELSIADSYYEKLTPGGTWERISGSNEVTFTNVYSADAVEINFNAGKELTGRSEPLEDGEFTFNIALTGWKANDSQGDWESVDQLTDSETPKVTTPEVKNGNKRGDVIFSGISFTKDMVGKTYCFAITEHQPTKTGTYSTDPADGIEGATFDAVTGTWTYKGVTYDNSTKIVTAQVTDEKKEAQTGDDAVQAVVRVHTSGEAPWDSNAGKHVGDAVFINTYKAGSTTVDEGTDIAFGLTKQFTGRDGNAWLEGDEFGFTLSAGTASDGGAVPMPDGSESGAKTVTVGANDVTDTDNGIAPINFGAITFDRTGTYTYTVTENGADGTAATGGTKDGITYAANTVNITVTVTDNGTGGLVAAVTKTGEAASAGEGASAVSFANTYDSTFDYGAKGAGGLDITKTLEGRAATAGQFHFTVSAADEVAAEKIGGETAELASVASAAGEAASVAGNPFDTMTFSRADAGKTFTYTIAETGQAPAGYTYDASEFTVDITPADNGDGTMSVTTHVSNNEGYSEMVTSAATLPQKATVPFTNSYAVDPGTIGANGVATIQATKTLHNDVLANGQFDFTVADAGNGATVATGTNAADGTITFSDIVYTTDELNAAATAEGSQTIGKASKTITDAGDVYTFVYNVAEDTLPVGYTQNAGNSTITVTVTDNGAGKLDIQIAYPGAADGLVFENTYGTGSSAELSLAGSKAMTSSDPTLSGPELKGGEFDFTITGAAADDGTPAPMPETTTVSNTGYSVNFGPITYTMENVFGGQQTDADASGAAGDKNTGDVNEDTSAVGDANEDASAGNDAAASAEDKAAGNEGGVEHATGDESAVAASAEDSTSTSQSERSKTFVYTITEVAGKGLPGVTNDSTTKTVTVTVTDNGDGTLSVAKIADKSADKGMDFTFTNTYSTTPAESSPTGDGGLTFTKVWDRQSGARNLAAGDFTFKMEDAQGTEYTATNDANGNVEMPAITFSEAGDYTYTLSEVVPDGAKPVADGYELNGVTYHAATYTVTAHVVDNHSGTLEVTWNMVDGQGKDTQTATFTNTYNVQPTTITFGASKALEGRSVAADEFSFALKDADGNVLGTATNDAKGQVVFTDARQTFSEAGTYTYTVSEVLPQDDDPATEGIQKDGVTYDETVYTAQVTLVDGNNGQLTIEELTYNDVAELPTFVNSYNEGQEGGVEPSGGEGDSEGGHFLEKTGDNPWLIGLLVALIAAAAGTAGYAGRKTWKKNAAANHAAAHLGKHGRL